MNKIVTLCGSTRFKDDFLKVCEDLTLKDNIVLMPGVFGHSDGVVLTKEDKIKLDRLHKRKIAMSDVVYVINRDGYIGDSTHSEILFAKYLNIPIIYMEEQGEENE